MGSQTFVQGELPQHAAASFQDLIQSVIRTDSAEQWLARLEEESVPCPPVLTRTEVLNHPQVQANDLLVEYNHPQAGHIRQTRAPARFSATIDFSVTFQRRQPRPYR